MNSNLTIKVKYHNPNIERLKQISIGNWIDLRAAETITMKKGDFRLISLGISMKLPEGYEAHVAPRSSTFKNFKIIQTNSFGIIDNSYSGENDIWRFPAYAMEDTTICEGDRICQFRIQETMPTITFEVVDHMEDKDRGGFGITGVK